MKEVFEFLVPDTSPIFSADPGVIHKWLLNDARKWLEEHVGPYDAEPRGTVPLAPGHWDVVRADIPSLLTAIPKKLHASHCVIRLSTDSSTAVMFKLRWL